MPWPYHWFWKPAFWITWWSHRGSLGSQKQLLLFDLKSKRNNVIPTEQLPHSATYEIIAPKYSIKRDCYTHKRTCVQGKQSVVSLIILICPLREAIKRRNQRQCSFLRYLFYSKSTQDTDRKDSLIHSLDKYLLSTHDCISSILKYTFFFHISTQELLNTSQLSKTIFPLEFVLSSPVPPWIPLPE